MGKKLEYPLASFKKSLEIADAVDSLGGSCTIESCADKLNRQPSSGGYKITVSTASKFGLIEIKRGVLSINDLYKQAKLAYSDEERKGLLRKAFFRPEVFSALYQRFQGLELPGHLDKLMVRELGVEENVSGRVAGYFIDGLKEFGLIGQDGKVVRGESISVPIDQPLTESAEQSKKDEVQKSISVNVINNNVYVVHITGPGLNQALEINEEEDLVIVNAVLNKIKKALSLKSQSSNPEENVNG
jgi:hypothetical protein